MSLPLFQTGSIVQPRDFTLMQTAWKRNIDPVLALPINSGVLLQQVKILTGTNVINTLLGRTLIGWFLTDIDGVATLFRSAPKNSLTLTLTSSAAVTADIFVF